MKEVVRFRVYFIAGPDWESLPKSRRIDLGKSIAESPLFGKSPNRFGFAKVRYLRDDWVLGYFTQEFEAKRHKYDQSKHEHPYTDQPFEDSLTIVLLDQGLVFLQNRRFRDETISMTEVSQHFDFALRSIIRDSDLPYYGLEPYILKFDKAAFLHLFPANNVLSVSVKNLINQVVPDDFVFFNPEAEKDLIVREMMNSDLKSFDELSLSSSDKGPGLQKSKVAKMALTVGEPEEMTYREKKTRSIRTIRRQVGPTHSLEIDVDQPEAEAVREDLNRFFSREAGKLVRQRRIESSFDEDEDLEP